MAVIINTAAATRLIKIKESEPDLCINLNQVASIEIPIKTNKLDRKIFSFSIIVTHIVPF